MNVKIDSHGSAAPGKSETVAPGVVSNDIDRRGKPRVLSFLDTLGITRPQPDTETWLDELGELTKAHRETRARAFEAKAVAAEKAAFQGNFHEGAPRSPVRAVSDQQSKKAGRWYRSRAKGQRRRIEAVKNCRRESALMIACEGCGAFSEKASRCGVGVLCVSCRGQRARVKRGTMARAIELVLDRARDAGLLRSLRRGGRWSQKLLTLTAPHLSHVDADSRTARIRAAWPRFLKQFNKWLRARDADERSAWVRNTEWEPSKHDANGHPHIHAWLFCPYLPRELLIEWWGRALLASGYTRDELGAVDVAGDCGIRFERIEAGQDIREASGGNVVFEVIKYLTKDLTSSGGRVAPEQYAHVVRAFDGARTTQASRGFMALGRRAPARCACGTCETYTIRVVPVAPLLDAWVEKHTRARSPPQALALA